LVEDNPTGLQAGGGTEPPGPTEPQLPLIVENLNNPLGLEGGEGTRTPTPAEPQPPPPIENNDAAVQDEEAQDPAESQYDSSTDSSEAQDVAGPKAPLRTDFESQTGYEKAVEEFLELYVPLLS